MGMFMVDWMWQFQRSLSRLKTSPRSVSGKSRFARGHGDRAYVGRLSGDMMPAGAARDAEYGRTRSAHAHGGF